MDTRKRLILFLALAALAFGPQLAAQQIGSSGGGVQPWTFSRNADTVSVGGMHTGTIETYSNFMSVGSGSESREFFMQQHQYRGRSGGPLYGMIMYTGTGTALVDSLYVRFWHHQSATGLDVEIGRTGNLVSAIDNPGIAELDTLWFPTPVVLPDSAREGWYVSIRGTKPIGTGRALSTCDTSSYARLVQVADAYPDPNGYDWDGAVPLLSGAYTWPVRFLGQAPHGVALGTSIVAGHAGHYSYRERRVVALDRAADNPDSTITGWLHNFTGYDIQNMGIGGEQTPNLIARLVDDALDLHPQFLIWEGGSNDINGWGATMATVDSAIIARTAQVRDSCQAHGIVLIATLMPPRPAWADANDSLRCDTRDSINRKLRAMLTQHEYAPWTIIIDLDYVIGAEHPTADNRLGGRAYGNRWDLSVSNDGAHFFGLGYRSWASAIYRAMLRNPRADVN